MKKTTIRTAALALPLALVLAACGSEDDTTEGTPDTATVEETEQAPTDDGTDAGNGESATDESATDQSETNGGTTDESATDDTDDTDDGDDQSDDTASGDLNDHNQAAIDAIGLAEDEVGGQAFEIDFDDGEFEVEVSVDGVKFDVHVSGDGTSVLGSEQDDPVDGDDLAGLDTVTITLDEALQAAFAELEGNLDDAQMEDGDSNPHWEVDLDTADDDATVHVGPDGEILGVDLD